MANRKFSELKKKLSQADQKEIEARAEEILADPFLGPNDEYMYECFRCSANRVNLLPHEEWASYSRNHGIIVAAAKAHFKNTGHRVQIFIKKLIAEVY